MLQHTSSRTLSHVYSLLGVRRIVHKLNGYETFVGKNHSSSFRETVTYDMYQEASELVPYISSQTQSGAWEK